VQAKAPAARDADVTREQREALAQLVRKVAEACNLTGELMERARRADQVVVVDFFRDRYEVSLEPRVLIATCIPPDVDDDVLREMAKGQPILEPGEGTAAWCFACDNAQPGEPSTHMRLCGHLPQ
jgi:hypothetical protein